MPLHELPFGTQALLQRYWLGPQDDGGVQLHDWPMGMQVPLQLYWLLGQLVQPPPAGQLVSLVGLQLFVLGHQYWPLPQVEPV